MIYTDADVCVCFLSLSSVAASTSPIYGVFNGLLIMGGHHHISLPVGCYLLQDVVEAPV